MNNRKYDNMFKVFHVKNMAHIIIFLISETVFFVHCYLAKIIHSWCWICLFIYIFLSLSVFVGVCMYFTVFFFSSKRCFV